MPKKSRVSTARKRTTTSGPPEDPTDLGGFQVVFSVPETWRCNFERKAGKKAPAAPDDEREDTFKLSLGLNRLEDAEVLIELVAEGDIATSEFLVATRVAMRLNVKDGADVDVEAELAEASRRIGPVVLYPYVRETVTELFRRAGLAPLVLPVMNVGSIFGEEDVPLPAFKGEPNEATAKEG